MRAPGDTVTIVPVEKEDILQAVEAEFMQNHADQLQQQSGSSGGMTPYLVGGVIAAGVLIAVYALTR